MVSMQQHLPRILQWVVALPFLILTMLHLGENRVGQNILNLSAVGLYVVGLDHILIIYRWLTNKQSFEYELTFLFGFLYVLSKLFEKFHPTEINSTFNQVCDYNILAVLIINLAFALFLVIVIVLYACRQIYRLMSETLLATSQNLDANEIAQIQQLKQPFSEILRNNREAVEGNATCSICLMEFEQANACVLLPGCKHCFHSDCIEGWLQSQSTCPYCRDNVRLSLL